MKQVCKIHGITEFYNRKDSNTGRCRKCMTLAVQKRREKIAKISLEYKGNKCSNCGYDKCSRALEFHHLDPTTKSFGIAAKGATRSWEVIKKELDKCVLLCANCHRELHSKLHSESL